MNESVDEDRKNDVLHTFLCAVDDEKDKQERAIMFALDRLGLRQRLNKIITRREINFRCIAALRRPNIQ